MRHSLRLIYFRFIMTCFILLGAWPHAGVLAQPGNRLLLRPVSGGSQGALRQAQAMAAATVTTLPGGIEVWTVPAGTNTEALAQRLRATPGVSWAEPDYPIQALIHPQDPAFNRQWALHNTGQDAGLPGADINMLRAWGLQTGSDQVVAGIIDSGIDWTHPDLIDNIWQNLGEDADGDGRVLEYINGQWVFDPGDINGIDDDGNGYVDDFIGWDFVNQDNDPRDDHLYGHGTHVAGIVAARGDNGVGIAGVSWRAKLMPLKILDTQGGGFTSAAVEALTYALQMGVPISNNSWGGPLYSQALETVLLQAQAEGHLFVAAAGNNYGNNNDVVPFYPAAYPFDNVVTVTATNFRDSLSRFANIGPVGVDLGAPGEAIYSTLPGEGYGYLSGTSMSAPFVTGALCLLQDHFPGAGYAAWKDRLLRRTASRPALRGKAGSGGRLDVFEALRRPVRFERSWQSAGSLTASWMLPLPDRGWLLGGQQGGEAHLLRLDANGVRQWQRRLDGSTAPRLDAATAGPGDQLWVAGTRPGPDSGAWLGRLAPDGSLLAQYAWDPTTVATLHQVVTRDATLAVLGTTPSGQLYWARLDTSGQVLQARTYDLDGRSLTPTALLPYPGGDWLVTGSAQSSTGSDAFLLWLRPNGQIRRAQFLDFGVSSQGQGLALWPDEDNDGDDDEAGVWLTGWVETGTGWDLFALGLEDDGDLARAWQFPLDQTQPAEIGLVTSGDSLWVAWTTPAAPSRVALMAFTSEGQSYWGRTYAPGPNPAQFRALAPARDGGFSLLGQLGGGGQAGLYLIRSDESGRTGCPDQPFSPPSPTTRFPTLTTANTSTLTAAAALSATTWTTVPSSWADTVYCDNSQCVVQAYFETDTNVVCEDAILTFTNLSQQATAYEWRANGVLFSTAADTAYEFDDGLVEIRLTAIDGGCSDTYRRWIEVEPELVLTLTDTVHCGPALTLDAGLSGYRYRWTDAQGVTLGEAQRLRLTSSGEYELTVTNACDEEESVDFEVTLQADCVWPGDVNADGYVDMIDFLLLGQLHGQTGPPRPGASTAYTSQLSPDWTGSFPASHPWAAGINYKHADCDGDGQIDAYLDGAVIRQNAVLPPTLAPNAVSGPISLSLEADATQVWAGDSIGFTIKLGLADSSLIQQGYGVAFSMNYSLPVQFDPAVDTTATWLRNSGPGLASQRISWPARNRLDLGLTRLNQLPAAGTGQTVRMCCITVDIDDIGTLGAQADRAFLSASVENALLLAPDGTRLPVNVLYAQGTQGIMVEVPRLQLDLRAWLQGPYDSLAGQHRTDLVTQGLLPLASPYDHLPPAEVSQHAPQVVDWIGVELWTIGSNGLPGTYVGGRAALLRDDGSIVDAGNGGLLRVAAPEGTYFVVLRHRNHLPLISAQPLLCESQNPVSYDFGQAAVLDPAARILLAPGRWGLRAGDLNGDGQLQYSGPGNDRRLILTRLGGDPDAVLPGYWPEDLNLDGAVRYLGPADDRAVLRRALDAADPTAILPYLRP